jgi:hypothetical protein
MAIQKDARAMLKYLIIPTITLFAMWIFEYGTLTRRGPVLLHVVVRLISVALLAAGYRFLHVLRVENLFWYYAINLPLFAAMIVLFSESLAQKVFWFFTGWEIGSFLSSICFRIAFALFPETEGMPLRAILYVLGYAAILPVYLRCWRDGVRKMLYLFDHEKPVYAIFPTMSFSLFVMLFGPYEDPSRFRHFGVMLFFIFFVSFLYFLLFTYFNAVFERSKTESRLKDAETQLSLQRKYYAEVENGVRSQRELLHDVRHHLVTINYLAKNGDTEEILVYIRELIDSYDTRSIKRYCENAVVNAIIGGYAEIAAEKGIPATVELDLPQTIGINEYDLCILFGNTIENAIEACLRIPPTSPSYENRSIVVKSRVETDRLIVRVENTFEDAPKPGRHKGFSSSKGPRDGVGLESVRAMVDQNGGCMSCERSGNLYVFSAIVSRK